MQQSSSSIGNLAAALARAQVELINPENSMVATMPADGKRAAEQIFRYAPLSSGSTLSARPWANMSSPPCRQPRSTMQPESSMLPPHWPIRRENGSPRIGRFAHLTRWLAPSGWERR